MSDSRLEKFIYAICSMDVTDLPVPLSRIEKLWNCLITGETPDFEPLSRNEKYLMAMLDRYDLNNLPAPMSRGEKLLYKIAVGETDLSDVPEYLSRYEELLKYLIENGGISGGDFEYVLYTLNQSLSTLYTTAEKPVKSAILKGQTLVNLVPKKIIDYTASNDWDGFRVLVQNSKRPNEHWRTLQDLKPNTKYYISCYVETFEDVNSRNYHLNNPNDNCLFVDCMSVNGVGHYQWISTTRSEFTDVIYLVLRCQNSYARGKIKIRDIMIIEYVEGMEELDIPYFEGMQSVKLPVLTTTGENLIDSEIIAGWLNTSNGEINNLTSTTTCATKDLIKVKPATQYSVYKEYDKRVLYAQFNEKQEFINFGTYTHNGFSTDSNAVYVRLFFETPVNEELKAMLYEGGHNSNISYEPYKSNILTTPEDLELRGIGNVKDELDLMTGKLKQVIGEMTVDNLDGWWFATNADGSLRTGRAFIDVKEDSKLLCDLLPTIGFNTAGGQEGVAIYINQFVIYTGHTNENDLKSWLQQNRLTIQYELATESVKTVDLTVVNQDNQPTQLGTFENVTHVSLESAGLIPTLEMEVATHISKELASASPLMDDISTNQQQLGKTVDEQSNNVDATMIATTEIYEETL